jgi:serine/threonine-protein kinase
MKQTKALVFVYVVLLIFCVAFVLLTAQSLPLVVASHFDAAGHPNAHMPRDNYIVLYMALLVLVPSCVAALPWFISKIPMAYVNLPNRTYWLAPEKMAETKQVLQSYMITLAIGLVCFLTGIHWLVLKAHQNNSTDIPAQIPSHWLWIGTGLFVALTLLWSFRLNARFKQMPDSQT